jgi:hypothetical protein
MHEKRGDLNRDRRVARSGGWLDQVASTLTPRRIRWLIGSSIPARATYQRSLRV